MEALGAVVVAVIGTAGTLLAAWLGARRLGRVGLGDAQLQVNASLRELAQTWEEKAGIWKERFEAEQSARESDRQLAISDRTSLVDNLRATQRSLDDCDRQKDEVRSELRALLRAQRADPDSPGSRPIRRRPRSGPTE